MTTTKRKSKSIADSETMIRDTLWKDAPERLWKHKEAGGFFTVPKTMPYIARLMDETAKNTPLSTTYMALWSFTWSNDGFVKLGKILDIVYAAGFNGERGIRTLKDRLKKLEKLGFIEVQKSGGDQLGFVYIPNPHRVIIDAMRTDKPPFRKETYSTFVARAVDIGCKDVRAFLAEDGEKEDEEEVEDEPDAKSPGGEAARTPLKKPVTSKRPRGPLKRPKTA